jgi:hypothetical protein
MADQYEIRTLELNDDLELASDIEDTRDQKIAFMKAYLSILALDAHNFESDVRHLLNLQSRLRVPRVLGFWFWQSDIEKFGAGVSPFFRGEKMSVFCERANQIDFSDISAILPFDRITVRLPKANWNNRTSQKLAEHIAADLNFDGVKTKIKFTSSWEFLDLDFASPDYGHELNVNRLRASRASALYHDLIEDRQ